MTTSLYLRKERPYQQRTTISPSPLMHPSPNNTRVQLLLVPRSISKYNFWLLRSVNIRTKNFLASNLAKCSNESLMELPMNETSTLPLSPNKQDMLNLLTNLLPQDNYIFSDSYLNMPLCTIYLLKDKSDLYSLPDPSQGS